MSRAERRYKTEVKLQKRRKLEINNYLDEDDIGKLRDCHMGCGCSLCKPWKHGLDKKYKPNELRKIQNDGESDL